ncbi:hypothetical protein Kpol_526p49 [Vanderwaltozyma polyspora DSM 70294]|uniref:DUF3533 domain-containing protein n=1 Tax=Vanderwaltozyma polyspora (strain ATCC 22028 / DSM 70294 / BCRC 21397 / CBS 2163 / NBRC 10782 / NRRL Y-8283 / UCD 57-17) TaxID=436907 RepID=A7TLV4_VANPO|nr:uncharacterized protein Kpol_526p49 [Vanderwaltozyma polyspora DSM 70294]EDO16796.1 hypothetical protein Kpol_526p49 [Vanderwaltozyma polyspora DSM 70294]
MDLNITSSLTSSSDVTNASTASTTANDNDNSNKGIEFDQNNDYIDKEQQYIVPPKFNFWNQQVFNLRFQISKQFLINLLILAVYCFGVISIYWGASYDRNRYIKKVNILAVLQDEGGSSNISQLAYDIVQDKNNDIKGTWKFFNQSSFMDEYGLNDTTLINDKIFKLVHNQNYWFAINIKENATKDLEFSLSNTSGQVEFNTTDYFEVGYESGRDPSNLKSSILPIAHKFESIYRSQYLSKTLPGILSSTNETIQNDKLISASNVRYNYIDWRPFVNPVVLSPLQVGSVFSIILTVIQFGLWGPIYLQASKILNFTNFSVFRIIISMTTLFFLSLFYCTVSAMFQVDFTLAFGNAGFMVYWMSTWLVMMAVGGANENMMSLINTYFPQYLPIWFLTWIIINVAPTFFPLALNNNFYRYGYAFPTFNGVAIYKVIFFDLSKNSMGRNYGILGAWCVLNYTLMPIFIKIIALKNKQKLS